MNKTNEFIKRFVVVVIADKHISLSTIACVCVCVCISLIRTKSRAFISVHGGDYHESERAGCFPSIPFSPTYCESFQFPPPLKPITPTCFRSKNVCVCIYVFTFRPNLGVRLDEYSSVSLRYFIIQKINGNVHFCTGFARIIVTQALWKTIDIESK